MLPTDKTRRPQAVKHGLNDLAGFEMGGLLAGRCSGSATGGLDEEEASRVPEARSWRVQGSLSAAVVRTAPPVAEGVRDSAFDAHFRRDLCAVTPCVRAVHEPTLRCTWCFRTAPQLITLRRTISRLVRLDSAAAVAGRSRSFIC